jgi:hypothetical protein
MPLLQGIDARSLEWWKILCRYNMPTGKDKKTKEG